MIKAFFLRLIEILFFNIIIVEIAARNNRKNQMNMSPFLVGKPEGSRNDPEKKPELSV